MQTILLKSVHPTTDPEEILAELRQGKNDDVSIVGVKPFTTASSKRENRKLPFFLIQITPDSRIESLNRINRLGSITV